MSEEYCERHPEIELHGPCAACGALVCCRVCCREARDQEAESVYSQYVNMRQHRWDMEEQQEKEKKKEKREKREKKKKKG
jgi:hypothetical protein